MTAKRRVSPAGRHWQVTRSGAVRGARAFLKLMAVVAPVYTVITVLRYTPVLAAFAGFTAPLMRHFGLPGDAALALILGNVINLYAGLGAITALHLPADQLTVLAVMLLLSHSQILETAVFFRMRAKWWLLWAIRLAVSLLAGLGLGRLLVPATADAAAPALAEGAEAIAHMARPPWPGPGPALSDWALGLADTGWKMLAVLVGIFIALEFAKRYGLLEKMLTGLNRLTRHIGLSREAGLPWLGGNVFGIVFGGGLIIESTHAHKLSPRQVTLVATFLALSHGLFEDTAIFVVLGANVLWITVPRLLLAILVTWLLSRILREKPPGEPLAQDRLKLKHQRRAGPGAKHPDQVGDKPTALEHTHRGQFGPVEHLPADVAGQRLARLRVRPVDRQRRGGNISHIPDSTPELQSP